MKKDFYNNKQMIAPSNPPCTQQPTTAPDHSVCLNSTTASHFSVFAQSTQPSMSQINRNAKSSYFADMMAKTKELQQALANHYTGPRNSMYDPGKDEHVRLFRTPKLSSFDVTVEGKTEGLFTVKLGRKTMQGYAFLYEEGYWYFLMASEKEKGIISQSAKNYSKYKYENVTKGLLTKITATLYNAPTKIHHDKFPVIFKKYVNFKHARNSSVVPDDQANLAEQLDRFLSFILEWGINMTVIEMRNTFLNKVGHEHEEYVHRNRAAFERVCNVNRYGKERMRKNCSVEDQLTGPVTFKGNARIDPSLFVATLNQRKFIRIDFEHLFKLYVGQNIYHYRRSNIKHIYIDGTGSLPAPFTQMINISYFDPVEVRHRYLCSFLLEDTGLMIDQWLWLKILTSLKLYVKFDSASVDNEFALLDALNTLDVQIWGCHAHYIRNISRFTAKKQSKIRQKFYALIKYFMFLPDREKIFERMDQVVANNGEREIYNYVKTNYMRNNYFQYDDDIKGSREKAAWITTSPLEGINGALKIKLRKDKSVVSIIQFIKEKSQQKLNLAKPVSTYQRVDYQKVLSGLRDMEETTDSEGKQLLMDAFVTRQQRVPRWKRLKLRAEECRRSGELEKYNRWMSRTRSKYHKKFRDLQEQCVFKSKLALLSTLHSLKIAAKAARDAKRDYETKIQNEQECLEYQENLIKFFTA